MSDATTQQVTTPPNPTGKGGFGDNPQNRNPGGWKKEDSISYQYNLLMRMNEEDLKDYKPKTVAQKIALNRIKEAMTSLNDVKEITDRTEGKAPQYIGLGGPEDAKKALVEFIYGPDDSQNTDTN